MMNVGIIFLLVIGVVFLVFFLFLVILYNSFIQLKNDIRKSWANIDVLLRQRSDEIPNLIGCVKGYMQHERATLDSLTNARASILQAEKLHEKAAADNVISASLKTIFAVAENYPDLKANQNFLRLQERITELENELADRRELYNDSVTIYNTRVHSFPDLLVARLMRATDEPWFKATEADHTPPQYTEEK